MKKFNHIYRDFKLFAIISLSTGIIIFLFSLVGHFISAGKLIPYCMAGGSIGILTGSYFLFRQSLIKKENIIAVSVFSLIAFGVISLIAIFNFDKPFLIVSSFLLIGLTTVFSNRYFLKNKNISDSLKYGLLGIILILPTVYFISSSILKFRFGINAPFNFIEDLLQRTNGQANFNAISPFIFGGGLSLAFLINLFVQIRLTKSKTSMIKFKLNWANLQPFNLTVLLLSCSLSSVILTYLLLEN
jgi:hypothetical protein